VAVPGLNPASPPFSITAKDEKRAQSLADLFSRHHGNVRDALRAAAAQSQL
jgi:hypothetical protein